MIKYIFKKLDGLKKNWNLNDVINLTDKDSYILSLKPQRVIFNPGSENPKFEALLTSHHIQSLRACTLVLLSTGQY